MPRVLRIMNRLNLGGPTYNAAYLSKYLPAEYETMLLAGMKDESEESSEHIIRSLGLEVRYIPSMKRRISFAGDIAAFISIIRVIRSFRPDIVHTHAAKAGALGRLAAFLCGVPVIVHTFHGHVFHSYFNKFKTSLVLFTERMLAGMSTAIIAISELQKAELCQVYKIAATDKVYVIPLGFDLSKFQADKEKKRSSFREKYLLEPDEIAIGIIGRLVPVKNHALFIKAFKELSLRTQKRVRAFIIGDGEMRQKLLQLASSLQLDHVDFTKTRRKASLTFTSWIHAADVAIAGLDIIALSSWNEGTPVSLIEAQAGSKPIVSTDVGGIADVVIPEKTALLVEKDDPDQFVFALQKLVEDEQLRRSMAEAGYSHVQGKFHYRTLTGNMAALYGELLRKKIK